MEGPAPGQRILPRALAALTAAFGIALTAAGFVVEDVPAELSALSWILGPAFLLGGAAAWRAADRARLDLAFAACLVPLLGLYMALASALGRPRVEAWSKVSRPMVRAIAAHREGAEPIVNYHVWLRAIPFYLDERVITVSDEGRVTAFEEDDTWRAYVFTADTSFYRILAGPARVLTVVRRTEVDDVEAALGAPLAVLATDERHALVTNRPTAAERGRPPADQE
jgi:hypothetical protein